jgi:hypothetical protein
MGHGRAGCQFTGHGRAHGGGRLATFDRSIHVSAVAGATKGTLTLIGAPGATDARGDGTLPFSGHAALAQRARNARIWSLMNAASAGLPPPPAEWPHSDGMGMKVEFFRNCCSYRASPIGKYKSVSHGI